MAKENVVKFEQLLQEDEALQAKLQEATNAFIAKAIDERALFDAVIAPLAESVGLPYTYDEAAEAGEAREIDDAELDAVAGGTTICLVIGFGDDVDAGCGRNEGHACAYVGVGIIDCTK